MSDQERPPLWQVMRDGRFDGRGAGCSEHHGYAFEIRAVAQYLQDHGLVSATVGKATPGSHARLLEALEHEARRAEVGEWP